MITVQQMKELECCADAAGLTYLQMMENAGRAAAAEILHQIPNMKTAAVFCGKGNNGGDGLVVARILKEAGIGVLIVLVEGKPVTPDAVTNLFLAARLDIPMVFAEKLTHEDIDWISVCDCVIDAIYGTGFHGELRIAGELCCGIMNQANGKKFALDVPSGVASDTGKASQGAFCADCTFAFHDKKPCHQSASDFCGEILIAEIGIRALQEQGLL